MESRIEKIIAFVSGMKQEKYLKPGTVYQVYYVETGSDDCLVTNLAVNLFNSKWAAFEWLYQNVDEFVTYEETQDYGWDWKLTEVAI